MEDTPSWRCAARNLLQIHDPVFARLRDFGIGALAFGKETDTALGQKRVREFEEFRQRRQGAGGYQQA
jgi:hypothetical protein